MMSLPITDDQPNRLSLPVFWTANTLLFAAVLAGSLFPQSRTWGFHFLAYYLVPVRWILIAGAVVLLSIGLRWFVQIKPPRLQPLTLDILTAVFCGLAFVIFKNAAPVLGDGQLWINELNAGSMNIWTRRGPLTLGLAHLIYNTLYSGFPNGALWVFRDLSAIAGAVTIFGWLQLAREYGVNPMKALLFGFTWGGIAQFFGYVELYSVMIAMVSTMLVLMLISIRKQQPNWWVFILAIAAPLFHLIALTFWPSVIGYLWWCIIKRPLTTRAFAISLPILFGAALMVYFVLGWFRGTDILLPIWSAESGTDSLVSWKHMGDLLNGIVLAAGPGASLLIALRAIPIRNARIIETKYVILFLALSVPAAAYVMHNPQLGMPRDWDIGATCLLGIPIALIICWSDLRLVPQVARQIRLAFAAWLLVLIVPWIGVQASETRSIARFTDLLRLDPSRSATGWDYLGAYYGRENDMRAIAHCYEEALKYENNTRYHRELSVCYAAQREWRKAHDEADIVWKSVSADSVITPWESKLIDLQPFMNAAGQFLLNGDFDNANQMYLLASALNPRSDVPDLALAGLMVCAGELKQAEDRLQVLIAKDSSAVSAVMRFFEILINKENHPVEGWLGLGVLARMRGDLDKADMYVTKSSQLAGGIPAIEQYLKEIRAEKLSKAAGKFSGQ